MWQTKGQVEKTSFVSHPSDVTRNKFWHAYSVRGEVLKFKTHHEQLRAWVTEKFRLLQTGTRGKRVAKRVLL